MVNRNKLLMVLDKTGMFNIVRAAHLKTKHYFLNKKFKKMIKNHYKIPLPTDFVFEPTSLCNLRCKMCYFDRKLTVKPGEMNTGQIETMIDNLPSMKRVNLIGGEPFMRRDIFEILAHLEKRGVYTVISTNGTLVSREKSERLKKFHNLEGLSMSIDGTKKTHNSIRGTEYAFDNTVNAMRWLKNDIFVLITTVFQKDNIHELSDTINLLADLGLSHFLLEHERRYLKEDIELTADMLDIPTTSFGLKISDALDPGYSLQELKKSLQTAEETARKRGIKIYYLPSHFKEKMAQCHTFSLRENGRYFCREVFKGRIGALGNVFHCPAIRHSFGNILEQPFEEIWNSEEHRSFRRKLVENNLLPVCKTCLYMQQRG